MGLAAELPMLGQLLFGKNMNSEEKTVLSLSHPIDNAVN